MPNLDAIIVPTARPSGHLRYAEQMAAKTNAYLVAFCSGQAVAAEVYGGLDIPPSYTHPLIAGFATDANPQALFGRRYNDVGLKRNLGLALARLTGWQTILFLDDDITNLTGLNATLNRADTSGAAGFRVLEFPDNSVVRHAERLSGVEPNVGISGGALIVNTASAPGFFPSIYNEDWLFLHDIPEVWHHEHSITGSARQLPYNPFRHPARAISEEFGDILAEGIRELSRSGLGCTDATESDWRAILDQRRTLLKDICQRLTPRQCEPNARTAFNALQAAALHSDTFTGRSFVDYVAAWRNDIYLWQERLAALPTDLSLNQALQYLSLMPQPAPVPDVPWQDSSTPLTTSELPPVPA